MNQDGDTYLQVRRETVEPVHAQLRQHGLDRIHVRGAARAASVVTFACIAHNLMKWKAREEEARALSAVA
jgi:IS5 family transposase